MKIIVPEAPDFRGTVIALCNLTFNFVKPWVLGGYRVVMVDPQHERTYWDGVAVMRIKATILEAMPYLQEEIATGRIVFVAGFPPCTDMAVSGARWFERKRLADPFFQAKAVAVAEQCRTIGEISGAPYLVENPVSVLSRVFGKAMDG
jgi:site-specific DNA-cytosine methylase